MSIPGPSPRTREQQFAFLRAAHEGPLVWRALCLALARQAAGLPAVYPSALAAQLATPDAYRVRDVSDLERGMVVYFSDPYDSNPYDHVATVAGWRAGTKTRDLGNLLTWTNDAVRSGGVDLVAASFYPERWVDPFQIGSTWLNGRMLPGFSASPDAPEEPPAPTVGAGLDRAIETLKRVRRRHREQGNDRIARALSRDLKELRETRQKFGGAE